MMGQAKARCPLRFTPHGYRARGGDEQCTRVDGHAGDCSYDRGGETWSEWAERRAEREEWDDDE